MVIDLVSFALGALLMALIVAATVGGVWLTATFLSRRAIIRFDDGYDDGDEDVEPAPVNPRIVPKSYPFSRN